ncbi:hypothetical protein TorRG33x02_358250, partial [Trema orientale]
MAFAIVYKSNSRLKSIKRQVSCTNSSSSSTTSGFGHALPRNGRGTISTISGPSGILTRSMLVCVLRKLATTVDAR